MAPFGIKITLAYRPTKVEKMLDVLGAFLDFRKGSGVRGRGSFRGRGGVKGRGGVRGWGGVRGKGGVRGRGGVRVRGRFSNGVRGRC